MSKPPLKGEKLKCAKKRSYADEFAARIAAMHSINQYDETERLWVYRCPHCSRWHLTRSRQKTPAITAHEPIAS